MRATEPALAEATAAEASRANKDMRLAPALCRGQPHPFHLRLRNGSRPAVRGRLRGHQKHLLRDAFWERGPYGIRTRAAAVRGRCPRPLDEWAVADAKGTESRSYATRVPEPRFGPFVFERIAEDEQFEPLDGILVRR